MSCTRFYVEPTAALMSQGKKEASNTSKAAMIEHEGAQLILYHYTFCSIIKSSLLSFSLGY